MNAWMNGRSARRLLLLAALCSSCVFAAPDDVLDPKYPDYGEPRGDNGGSNMPAVLAGVAALTAIAALIAHNRAAAEADQPMESDWATGGPELAPLFNSSAFAMRAAVRGGWPLVIDYAHGGPGQVEVQISKRGSGEVLTFPLPRLDGGRHIVRFQLPPWLGDDVGDAIIAVTARGGPDGTQTLPDFRIYGLGAGPEAVGSVAIDRLGFGPPGIRVSEHEDARYRFFSRSDFDSLSVEFFRVSESGDGSRHEFVDQQLLPGGVRPNHWVGLDEERRWDGRGTAQQTSLGRHRLQVRAWDADGDWVCAWSDSFVNVLQ
ncbi:hypothetical protein GCM10011348_14990 [Marinobacterium nitratireducens]|uniref:Uncharacterized protein n=1 Tax=Marinobacterium nitratireducens TaxID=518897 RepID=A0A917ZBY7_9GAMM|nr:hypothetical protein [Marinobacterium nitratireducens]GGO79792.1 hypothetical protein GCM10011348_14990 [Marinobacterium nitratireducens]